MTTSRTGTARKPSRPSIRLCAECTLLPATHHDTTGEQDLCPQCAGTLALDRMTDDGEFERITEIPEPEPSVRDAPVDGVPPSAEIRMPTSRHPRSTVGGTADDRNTGPMPDRQAPATEDCLFVCIEDPRLTTTGLCTEYSRADRQIAPPDSDPNTPLPPLTGTHVLWCRDCTAIVNARLNAAPGRG